MPSGSLLAVWIVVAAVINPCGDFMVNDDWAFIRSFQTLMNEGTLRSTGWGPPHAPGGPALIAQLLWAAPFSWLGGANPTTLRISVLTLAVVGSLGLFVLLSLCGTPTRLSLLGALTLALNPLFLSQSFSFMSDVPFCSFLILSVLFIYVGIQRLRTALVVVGLLFGLAATLTRQIGLVIPIAFTAAIMIHPRSKELGRTRMCLLAAGTVLVPWLAYELLMSLSGGTPITQHQVLHRSILYLTSRNAADYFLSLGGRLVWAIGYLSFFVSPLLPLGGFALWNSGKLRALLLVSLAAFVLLEIGLLAGLLDLPVLFHRNVLYDFGIGPVALKDVYVLGVERTYKLPEWAYYALVYWAFLSAVFVFRAYLKSFDIFRENRGGLGTHPNVFLAIFCSIAFLIYLTAILLTGFHDRYLIPLLALLIIQLLVQMGKGANEHTFLKWISALICLALIASFSVLGARDFAEMKRAQGKANAYIVNDLGVRPCNFDGGFEFNGYHCYDNEFKPSSGLSWWWVSREEYLVALGPLPGYEVVRIFPFRRLVGPAGAVHVLKPINETPGTSP